VRLLANSTGFLLGLFCLTAASWGASASADSRPASGGDVATPLCELLESISPGERRPATVRGIIVVGYETTMLYDPESPYCPLDVQSTTEVELSSKAPGNARLLKTAEASDGRAYVTLRGVLWGPDKVKEDDPTEQVIVAYSRRLPLRFGHMSYSRTQFVVTEVLASDPVPATVPNLGALKRPPESAFPLLLEAALPQYPELARRAGISGEVVVEVTIKAGRVAATAVTSGDRMLARAVLRNIETWRFGDDVEAKFTTIFVFVLELRRTGDDRNTRVDSRLPASATVVAPQEAQ